MRPPQRKFTNTISQLEKKLETLQSMGYEIHYDWFGGTGGGACQLGSRRCLFLDLALGAVDHLAQVDQLLSQEQLPGRRAA